MNLYECSVDMVLYVVADNEQEARYLASTNLSNESDNLFPSDFDVVENPEHIYGTWNDSEPYGDDCRTVGEIFAEMQEKRRLEKAEAEYRKKQGNLFDKEFKAKEGTNEEGE